MPGTRLRRGCYSTSCCLAPGRRCSQAVAVAGARRCPRAPACRPNSSARSASDRSCSSISTRSSAAASWPTGAPPLPKRFPSDDFDPDRHCAGRLAGRHPRPRPDAHSEDLAALVRQQAAEIVTLRARLDRWRASRAHPPPPQHPHTADAPVCPAHPMSTPPAAQVVQGDLASRGTVTRPFAPQLVPPGPRRARRDPGATGQCGGRDDRMGGRPARLPLGRRHLHL